MNGGTVPWMFLSCKSIPVMVAVVHVISGQPQGSEDWFQWLREGGLDQKCLRLRRVVWSFWVVVGCGIT
ncbi:hypothetical protein HanIR_Chr06g0283501 [Helianthus annuus]|nr:hypothetical protein HanIR_Chr06g0283501 [Helianthus annuus]